MTIKLGNRLAELRKEHGYSQEDLAEKLGVSRQAISKWECGEASPDTDNLIELARLYNTSLDELLEIKKPEENNNDNKHVVVDLKDDEGNSVHVTLDGNDENHKDCCGEHKHCARKPKAWEIIIDSVTVFGVVISYILLGTFLDLWAQAWVLFLLIPIIPSILEAIICKDMNKFAYPVLMVFIYFFVCMWLGIEIWHPLWVIYITIPVYYTIGSAINKLRGKEEKDD